MYKTIWLSLILTMLCIGVSAISIPQNVCIDVTDNIISISWNETDDAHGYRILSSSSTDGEYSEDTSGIFTSSHSWSCCSSQERKFYKVVACRAGADDVLVKRSGDKLRCISKYNSGQDIIVDIDRAAYNRLYTFSLVALSSNTNPAPIEKDGPSGLITLFNAGSDSCPAPYNMKRNTTPTVYQEWVGGAHLTDDVYNLTIPSSPAQNYPYVIPWQEITAIDANAGIISLADASLFPCPLSGNKHLIAYEAWVGSAYQKVSYFSYSGKEGNNLTGVQAYVDTKTLAEIGGLATLHPPKAAFVMTSAAPQSAPHYTLDGREIPDGTWLCGKVLKVDMINDLYDPISKRLHPNEPEYWERFWEESISYTITAGTCIDVLYNAECKKANAVSVYYGMQTMRMSSFNSSFSKYHFGHSANPQMLSLIDHNPLQPDDLNYYYYNSATPPQKVYPNRNSGSMSLYPTADKLIQYDPTYRRIHCTRMDLSYGTPANYQVMIGASNLANNYRFFGNGISKFYFTNIYAKSGINVGDIVTWRGSYIEASNLSQSDNTMAYYSYENGEKYLTIDVSGSENFPYVEIISHPLLLGKTLLIVQQDASISCPQAVGQTINCIDGCISFQANAYGVLKLKL